MKTSVCVCHYEGIKQVYLYCKSGHFNTGVYGGWLAFWASLKRPFALQFLALLLGLHISVPSGCHMVLSSMCWKTRLFRYSKYGENAHKQLSLSIGVIMCKHLQFRYNLFWFSFLPYKEKPMGFLWLVFSDSGAKKTPKTRAEPRAGGTTICLGVICKSLHIVLIDINHPLVWKHFCKSVYFLLKDNIK